MAKKNQNLEKFRRPELFLSELIRQSSRGEIWTKDEHVNVFYRAKVVAVDVEGGKLENENASGILTHIIDGKNVDIPANHGPSNPKNSIKARIITDASDQFLNDDELKVFWPLFQENDVLPIKPGEHVYVTFEDSNFVHGLWFGKVPGHENLNFAKGESFFKSLGEGSLANLFDDTKEINKNNDDVLDDDKLSSGRKIGNNLSKLFNGGEQ